MRNDDGRSVGAAGFMPSFPMRLLAGSIVGGVCAVCAPLAVYSLSLAIFGLPHVLSELRYVDSRFGRRLDRVMVGRILGLLSVVVAIRAATTFRILPGRVGLTAELAGVAALALLCARDGAPARKALATGAGLILGVGAALAPFFTVILVSILHNLTPLGFLWQIAPSDRRRSLMAGAAVAFLMMPLFIASGLPRLAFSSFFGPPGGLDPLAAGPLENQLFVYVPPPFLTSIHSVDIFSASVAAQIAHYGAVLVFLPWLLRQYDPSAKGLAPWPKGLAFALVCLFAGALSLARFGQGFSSARALYGIAAAFHAWLEVPVLILALTRGADQTTARPNRNDEALATTDTAKARSILNPAIQAISAASNSMTHVSPTMTDGQ